MASGMPPCSPWGSAKRAFSAKRVITRVGCWPSWRGPCDVSRYRSSRFTRWAQALSVACAYVTLAVVVFWYDVGDAGVAPVWLVLIVPPIYLALSFVLFRRASLT